MKFLRLLGMLALVTCAWAQATFEVKTPFVAQKRWALVIGASKYTEFGALNYAAADARDFAKSLVEAYGFNDKNVRTLIDDDPLRSPSAQATFRELDSLLSDRSLNQGDLFIFYFSGHGVGTPKGDYLVPNDASKQDVDKVGVPVKDLIGRFVKAGLKNVLVICDACRAGKENPFGAELQQLGKTANIAVMLGCAPGKRSYEYPQLGHGIFTYMLTRAMRNPALRDTQTGALWASAVVKKVQQDVASYTERDYGDDKQVPAIWGEGSTYDVLIGAYIGTDQFAQFGMQEITNLGHKMDRGAFKLLLRALAELFFQEQMFDKAVEAYKALEQLGEESPDELYALATSLTSLGREAEAQRIYERILREGKDKIVTDLAILAISPAKTTQAQRREAARNIYLDSPDWTNAYVYWSTITWQDPVTPEQRKAVLAEMLKVFGAESRVGWYLRGSDAYFDGDFTKAVQYLGAMQKVAGSEPESHDMLVLFFLIAERQKDNTLMDRIIEVGKKDPKHKPYWEAIETTRLERKSADERIAKIKERLKEKPEPNELLVMVSFAGTAAGELADEFAKAAANHPYAWEAHLAVWLCRQAAKGFPFPMEPVDPNVFKYGPSEIEVKRHVCDSLLELMSEANAPAEHRHKFLRYLFADYVKNIDKLGPRWELWMTLQTMGLDLGRRLQLAQLSRLYLVPLVKANPNNVQLKEQLLDFFLAAGAEKEAEEVFKMGNWDGPEAKGGDLRWAIHLATVGRIAELKELAPKLKRPGQKSLQEMYDALMFFVQAQGGNAADALEKKLDDFSPANLVAKQIAALARASLFKPKGPEPTLDDSATLMGIALELPDACASSNDLYTDVHAACLTKMHEVSAYIAKSAKSKLDDTVASIARTEYGNPLFGKIAFKFDPKIKDFVGEHKFKGEYWIDDEDKGLPGTLTVKVTADGKVVATLGGVGEGTFAGTIDAYGNLRADRVGGKGKAVMTAKLAPLGYSSDEVKSSPMRVAFVAETGDYVEFVEGG